MRSWSYRRVNVTRSSWPAATLTRRLSCSFTAPVRIRVPGFESARVAIVPWGADRSVIEEALQALLALAATGE
jgi:hypothetical protein